MSLPLNCKVMNMTAAKQNIYESTENITGAGTTWFVRLLSLRAGYSGIQFSAGTRFFSSSKCRHQLWGNPASHSRGIGSVYPGIRSLGVNSFF